jgi:phloretin hydrolase
MVEMKEFIGEEKSKTYYMDMPIQPQQLFDKINQGLIDWKDALKIEDRNDLLNPGYLPSEVGYCIMPDGSGFVANITKMLYVTPEMFDWWFAWHGLHSLRFKIWDKENHFDIETTKREQLLDPNLSSKQKLWGVTHTVTENLGFGPEKIHINFMSPGQLGFDINRFKEPYVSSVVGGNIDSAVMCHFIRKIEDGIELRSRLWVGYQIINKKSVKILQEEDQVPIEVAKHLALHIMKKYSNLAKLLPLIYYEQRNKW